MSILDHESAPSLMVMRVSSHATIPCRGSPLAIGLDLHADLLGHDASETLTQAPPTQRIYPGERVVIALGIAVAIPHGCYGRIAPRSGLAVKHGIDCLAGVIDRDYRGELKVVLLNTGDSTFVVHHGDRVAQLIVERAELVHVQEVPDLAGTARGAAGFGSTGVSAME